MQSNQFLSIVLVPIVLAHFAPKVLRTNRFFAQIVLRADQWRDFGRHTTPSGLAPANVLGEPAAACWSLELAEKLNNYLNI